MAKKKSDEEGKGGKKGVVVYVVLLVVGMFLGKMFLGGGGSAAAAGGTAGATTTTVKGTVVTMGETTVNLADGRLLKVGIALQLTADSKKAADAAAAKPDTSDPTKGWPEAMNMAIQVFGDQTYDQLLATGGRETARQLLAAKLKVAFPADISDVYFYTFVMQ